jgi:hypothetical protein
MFNSEPNDILQYDHYHPKQQNIVAIKFNGYKLSEFCDLNGFADPQGYTYERKKTEDVQK